MLARLSDFLIGLVLFVPFVLVAWYVAQALFEGQRWPIEVRCETCGWHGLEDERAELERCPSCGGPTIPA